MIHFGFTGTQIGWSAKQYDTFQAYIWAITNHDHPERFVLHHGDCVGADANAHEVCFELGWSIVVHPPKDPKKRAFVAKTRFWDASRCSVVEEREYLERNQHIVDAAEELIATPGEKEEKQRSGTWSTVRKGWKKPIPVMLIHRDGSRYLYSRSQMRIGDRSDPA